MFESHWHITLTGPQVRTLYAGFSGIRRLPSARREPLLDELQVIAEQCFDNRVRRNITTVLYLLRR